LAGLDSATIRALLQGKITSREALERGAVQGIINRRLQAAKEKLALTRQEKKFEKEEKGAEKEFERKTELLEKEFAGKEKLEKLKNELAKDLEAFKIKDKKIFDELEDAETEAKIAEIRAKTTEKTTDFEQKLIDEDEPEKARVMIEDLNQKQDRPFFYIQLLGKEIPFWPDIKPKVSRIPLIDTKGERFTMEDIRENAEYYKKSYEEVLSHPKFNLLIFDQEQNTYIPTERALELIKGKIGYAPATE
jgi:hypothetical protein